MTRVTLTVEGDRLSLRLEGHAGYAEVGRDIVCASASILAFTVAQLLLEMDANGRLYESPTVNLSEGDALIEAEHNEETVRIMHFAETGYALLQNEYPEHIKFVTVYKPTGSI